MSEVKQINQDKGQHFFDTSTMKFLNSHIVSKELINDKYFITSERFDGTRPRLYTIRRFNKETGDIITIGEFQQFHSVQEAKKYLIHLS
jgi:hypothetical protein